uniref:Mitochondrial inner membrane protein Mpv17 n=1 Tax=Glossina austeni TaxID=7395 RepID=A0A1A9UIQ7_GLOAU
MPIVLRLSDFVICTYDECVFTHNGLTGILVGTTVEQGSKILPTSGKHSFKTLCSYFFGGCRTAFLMGSGDLLAQHYGGAKNLRSINWIRTITYSSIGLFFIGPALTYWSNIMHPWSCVQRNRTFAVFKQIISDQVYLAPSLNLGLVCLSDITNENRYAGMERRICEKYMFVMKRHYLFWPAIQVFCTFVIQPSLKLFFANTIAIGWFAYLSIMLNNDKNAQKKVQLATESMQRRREDCGKNIVSIRPITSIVELQVEGCLKLLFLPMKDESILRQLMHSKRVETEYTFVKNFLLLLTSSRLKHIPDKTKSTSATVAPPATFIELLYAPPSMSDESFAVRGSVSVSSFHVYPPSDEASNEYFLPGLSSAVRFYMAKLANNSKQSYSASAHDLSKFSVFKTSSTGPREIASFEILIPYYGEVSMI